MYLTSCPPIPPSIPRTSKPVSTVLHIHRCPHSLTEFCTHVELTNFRTGSMPCTVLNNRFIIVIRVYRSQITGHTNSAFSSCHYRGPIFNYPVVLSYSPPFNRPNYFDGALGILLIIHLIYPRRQ